MSFIVHLDLTMMLEQSLQSLPWCFSSKLSGPPLKRHWATSWQFTAASVSLRPMNSPSTWGWAKSCRVDCAKFIWRTLGRCAQILFTLPITIRTLLLLRGFLLWWVWIRRLSKLKPIRSFIHHICLYSALDDVTCIHISSCQNNLTMLKLHFLLPNSINVIQPFWQGTSF